MPEIDVTAVLGAGGIAPTGTRIPKAERAASVSARAYDHPALPGRVVVRLSTEAIAPGVDIEMETLGFGEPRVEEKVGLQRERALGFPGWALIHDPAHAKFALAVMKDFKKAASRAKSKPGHARDAFVEIGGRLARSVPHFLPSFWEEAGRVFLGHGGETFAAQAFERARTAEKEHALAVDEEVRGTTFLEFTLAGAVSVKTLQAYAKVLVAKLGDEEGYERFLELTRRRTVGGLPPWSGMAKDLRALGKAAGKDLDAEDERLLGGVLDANAIARAPAEFWSTYDAALRRMARRDGAVRARLRRLFPRPSSGDDAFRPRWLELLDACGALEAVIATTGEEAAREAHGMAAEWVEKLLAYAPWDRSVVGLVERMVPRLLAEGTSMQLAQGSPYWPVLSVDVVELALAKGLPLAPPPERARFQLQRPFVVDPVLTAADPRFAKRLEDAVGQVFGQAAFEAQARGRAGLVAARRAWLERAVARAGASAIVGLEEALKQLSGRTTAAVFVEFPSARDALAALDARESLARALRGGVFAELGWPAFESAAAELAALSMHGFFPHAVVRNATRAIVIDGERRILEHDLRLPPKATVSDLFFVPDEGDGGQLYVAFFDPGAREQRAYWSGRPDETFAAATRYHSARRTAIPLPGGGVTLGARPFRIGDTELEERESGVLGDGHAFYVTEPASGSTFALDPATGEKRAAALPACIASTMTAGMKLTAASLQPAPTGLEGSPLGMKDGVVGSWTLTREADLTSTTHGVDGRSSGPVTSASAPTALLLFPGDERARTVRGEGYRGAVGLHDPDGRDLGVVGGDSVSAGWKLVPTPRFWHFLRPRDPEGSRALRVVTDAVAGTLLAAARVDVVEGEREEEAMLARARAAVRAELPAIGSDALVEGVAALVARAARAADHLASVAKRLTDPGAAAAEATTTGGPNDALLRIALPGMIPSQYGDGDATAELLQVSRGLEGEAKLGPSSQLRWEELFGGIRGLAVLALGPGVDDAKRATIGAFLAAWRTTIFAREPAHVRVVLGALPDESPFCAKANGHPKPTWLASEGESRYFVRILNRTPSLAPGTARAATFVEHARDGQFRLPPRFVVERELRQDRPDDAWLATFAATLAARGVPAWDAAAATALGSQAGLTRAEAILLWARLPGLETYASNFLAKELRATLDIGAGDAKAARETFKGIPAAARLALFAAAAPDDPAALWDPLGDSGPVARLAQAWIARSGRRVEVREDVVLVIDKGLDAPHGPAGLLHVLVAPEGIAPPAVVGRAPDLDAAFDAAFDARTPAPADRFTPRLVVSTALLVPFLFGELPVGDPYRAALAGLHAAVVAPLSDPGTLLPVISMFSEPKNCRALFDAIGGETVVGADGAERRDDGIVVARLTHNGGYLRAAVGPGRAGRLADATAVWKLHAATTGAGDIALGAAAFLQDSVPAFLARIADTPVPPGGYEANPSLSVPALLAEVAATCALSKDAAMLYLQLLALAEPTAKRVQTFNGWTPAAYRKAEAELVAAKRVVQGKRERAGREIFLPGGWEKGSRLDLPHESWKKPLYALPRGRLGRMLPPRPLHAMFEAAWARVKAGDAPKFEDV